MALSSTIYKAELQISDLSRDYYQAHTLRIACHPSESQARMMLRLLAFAMNADEQLSFGAGLSTDDEPDLWLRDYSGEIIHWIDLGQPTEKRVKVACGRARQVSLIAYSEKNAEPWWDKIASRISRFDNLAVYFCSDDCLADLERLCQRAMNLNVVIESGAVMLSDDQSSVEIELDCWKHCV